MLPKKTVVKVTPNAPVTKKVKQRNEYLRECFQTIINRELLHMNVKKVNDILINDVHVNLKSLPYRLQCVLAECLCNYMKVWPGWAKYEQHCKSEKSKRDYFEKFRQYLSYKMNYIIKNEHLFWNDPPPDASKAENKVSKEVQTENISKNQKPEAPYSLVISGQPNVLNNIVFIELDNNIVIKQHAEKPWKTLTIAEFLNYSFVYVEVILPDIHLSRSNLHEYQRYITECGDTATCPEVDFITYVRKTNRNVDSKVYTFAFISAYFAQFLEVIKQVPGMNMTRVTELEEIFKEFLKDIQATNLHGQTMATSTSVCYNIGGNKYIRNKKMVINKTVDDEPKKDTNAINFCEILIPRTSYTLHEFTAEEDPSTASASFRSLNEILCLIKKGKQTDFYPIIETINSCISYQCILCPKIYQGEHAYVEMLDHFRFLHKGEQSVLCFKCRRQFEVPKLSGDRWAHVCQPKTAGGSASNPAAGSSGLNQVLIVAANSDVASSANIAIDNLSGISGSLNNIVGNSGIVDTPVFNRTNNVAFGMPTTSFTNPITLPINTLLSAPNTTAINSSTMLPVDNATLDTTILPTPSNAAVVTSPMTLPFLIPLEGGSNAVISSGNSSIDACVIATTTAPTPPTTNYIIASSPNDMFADFSVDAMTTSRSENLAKTPVPNIIVQPAPNSNTDPVTPVINIANIMENMNF